MGVETSILSAMGRCIVGLSSELRGDPPGSIFTRKSQLKAVEEIGRHSLQMMGEAHSGCCRVWDEDGMETVMGVQRDGISNVLPGGTEAAGNQEPHLE